MSLASLNLIKNPCQKQDNDGFALITKRKLALVHYKQSPNTNLFFATIFWLIMQNFITAPNVLVSKKVEAR